MNISIQSKNLTKDYLGYYEYDSGDYDDLSTFIRSQPCHPVVVEKFLRLFAPLLYTLVLLVGLAGNGTVALVVLAGGGKRGGGPRPATDTFILHLAVSDLLLALTLPFWSVEAVRGWVFGPALCKAVGAAFALNLYGGILFLACISFDRYLSIVHAVHLYRRRKPHYVHATCLGVWLSCALLSTVDLVFRGEFSSTYLNSTICTYLFPEQGARGWRLTLSLAHQLLGFCLPTAVMVYCYVRIFHTLARLQMWAKQRALKVVAAVVLAFLVCWSPYNLVLLADTLRWADLYSPGCAGLNALDIGRSLTRGLGLLHACLNPLLYAFVGVKFRREMTRLLLRRRGGQRGRRGAGGKRGSSGGSGSETSTTYSTLW